VRSGVSVALDVRVEVTNEVVGQPPRHTGTPGVQNWLLVVESDVGDSRERVVVVLRRLRQCLYLVKHSERSVTHLLVIVGDSSSSSGQPPRAGGNPGMQASGGVVGEGKMEVRVLSSEVLVVVRGGQPPRRTGRPGMQSPVEEGMTGVRVLSCRVFVVVRVLSWRVEVVVRGGHPPRRTGKPGMQIGREMVADGVRIDSDVDDVLLALKGVVVVRVRSEVVVVEGACVVVVVVVVVVVGHPPSLTGRPGIHGSKGVEVVVTEVRAVVDSEVVVVERGQPPSPSGRPGMQGLTVVEVGSAVVEVEEGELRE
jgi:hypothetical protein